MRKTFKELDQLKEELGTDRLWSWSRVNKIHTSLYEYYLKYIKKVKEDRQDSIYVVTGGLSHDIIERFYNKELSYEDMITEFEDGWTTAMIADLKFDRTSDEKNEAIGSKYKYDLEHFFRNHKVLKHKAKLEEFVTIKVGEEYFQGYIDCVTKDDDGNYLIIDWKTSTAYTGAKALNESGQLVMYAMALNQLGIPYDKIKIGWNFLKYQNITVLAKNGKSKVRRIERCEIGSSLKANAKTWLKEFNYDADEIVSYLSELELTNDISVLPEEVAAKYKVDDCYVCVDLTEELIDRWYNYIIDATTKIRTYEKQYNELVEAGKLEEAEDIWCEDVEEVKAQSYYFANLCAYSANLHKPYKKYLELLDAEKNDGFTVSGERPLTKAEEDDDLSWLNDL